MKRDEKKNHMRLEKMKSYCNSSFQISTHSHNGNPDQELHVDFVLTFHLIPQLFESAKKKHNRNVNILMTMLLTPFLKIFPSFKSHIWLNFNCFDIKKEVYWCWIWFSLLDSIKVSAQNDKNQWIDLRQFSSSHGKFWMQSKKDKIFIEKKNWRTFDSIHYCSRMSSFVFAFR